MQMHLQQYYQQNSLKCFCITERCSIGERVSASYITNQEFLSVLKLLTKTIIVMINEDETTDLKKTADTEEDKNTYISDQEDVTQTSEMEYVTECETDYNNQSPIIMKRRMILIMITFGLTVGIMTLMKTLKENLDHYYHTRN